MYENGESSRRVFLKNTSMAALLSCFSAPVISGTLSNSEKSTIRKTLPSPRPMIPPVPAILLTINGDEEGRFEIGVVWTFVINSHPPQIGISVHDDHVVLKPIQKHGTFVLNVPTVDMANSFDRIDMNSKKEMDKFKLSGWSRGKAISVDAPTIVESPIQVECEVFNEIKVPPSRTIFVANVTATTVHEYVCDEKGQLDVASVPFFGMTPGSGEFYTMGKKVGHIGQSVGQDDSYY